ncbi:hypothetical protein CP061683_0893, partial [Chlamydia psittaci 06-1683]
MFFLI